MAFKLGSTLVGINNKIYLQNKAKKMEQIRKKPKEYYQNLITFFDFYIKRNFSEQGRNIGIEYQSCFLIFKKEFLFAIADAMGYTVHEKVLGTGLNELKMTGKGWLNDITDPYKSCLHVQGMSHSQSDLDYITSREEKDRLTFDQGGVNSRAAAYKNKDDERQEYNPEGYSDDAPF